MAKPRCEICENCDLSDKIESDGCRECLDLIGVIVVALRNDGTIAVINKRACSVLGYKNSEDLIGKNWFDVCIPEDDREKVRHVFDNQLCNQKINVFKSFENPVLCKDGSQKIILWHNAVILSGDNVEFTISSGEDITERVVMEGELNETKNKYVSLYDNSPDMRASVDPKTSNVIRCNKTLLDCLGYKEEEEVVGQSIFKLYYPESVDSAKRLFKKSVEKGKKVSDLELGLVTKDGLLVYTVSNVLPDCDENNTVKLVRFCWMDVTEQKRMEELVRSRDKELKIIMDAAPAMIAHKDKENRLVRVNKTFADVMGKRIQDVEGKSCYDLFPKDIAEGYYSDDLEVMKSGLSRLNIVEKMTTKNGEIWVRTDKIPHFNSDGEVVGVVAFILDITKEKEAEDILKQNAENLKKMVQERTEELYIEMDKFKRIFDTSSEGIVVCDVSGVVYEVNSSFLSMLGVSYDEIKKKGVYEVLTSNNEEVFCSAISAALEGSVVCNQKTEIMKDNKKLTVLLSSSPYPSDCNEEKVVMLLTDITSQIDAEETALRNEALAVAGTLAAGIAHEFNNINGIIKANVQLLEMMNLESDVSDKIKVLSDMVNRSTDITNNLLLFVKDRRKNGVECTNISEVVESTLGLVKKDFENSNIEIFKGDMCSELSVKANRSQIGQVLMNLFINAKHAMVDSEEKRLFISIEKSNGTVKVCIQDTGCGISEEDQKQLFRPFFSTKGEHSKGLKNGQRSVRGTGLGLSVALTIMKRNGGSIEVKSSLGKGSTFSVLLPVCEEKKKNHCDDVRDVIIEGNNERVLVLDDEKEIRTAVFHILKTMKYDPYETDDGSLALSEHEKNPFDVVVVDLLMPSMSGLEFLKKINESKTKVPRKIVLTGNSSVNGDCRNHGVDEIIMKPFDIEKLLSAIRRSIERQEIRNGN